MPRRTGDTPLGAVVNVPAGACPCGLHGLIPWPLVLDAADDPAALSMLLRDGGPRAACLACGRPAAPTAPVFVVSVANAPACWQRQPDPVGSALWSGVAARALIAAGRSDLAAGVLDPVPLTTEQLAAAVLHEPELTLPAARAQLGPWPWHRRVAGVLDNAEQLHAAFGPVEVLRELGSARMYDHAALIARAHPWLATDKAAQRVARQARSLRRAGRPHAATDLIALLAVTDRPAASDPGDEPASAALARHLAAGGRTLSQSAAAVIDALMADEGGWTARRTVGATWAGLAARPAQCARHTQACDCLEHCLELLTRAREGVEDSDVDGALGELAVVLVDVEREARAERLVAARAVYDVLMDRLAGDPARLALTQSNYAVLCNKWAEGDVEQVLRDGEQAALAALAHYTADEWPAERARTAGSLADNYSSRLTGSREENLREAVRWYEEAIAVRTRQDDSEGHAELRSNLAQAHLAAGSAASITRAVELLEDTRQFHANAEMTTQWLNDTCNLARALALTGDRNDLVRGIELLREAAATADKSGREDAFRAIGPLLAETLLNADDEGAADEATRLLDRALKQARAEGSDRAVRLAAGRLGILRLTTGELEAGAAALDEAIAASDRIRDAQGDPERRVSERTGDEDLFSYAAAAHVLLARPLRAVEAIERLRARELLAARGPAQSGVALPSIEAVREIIRPGTAALYAWAVQDRSFCLLLLDDGTGALETAFGMSFGMTAPAMGPRWGTAVVAAEPVEGRTVPSLDAVLGVGGGVPDFAALAGPLRELAEPWAGLLAAHGVDAVRVVACGPLANVPWALLPGPDSEPLGLSVVMTAPPSLSWAASAPLDGPAKSRTVVVADADPTRPLPYAAAEADHISRHDLATRLIGAAANREGVLQALADARVLHVACHGAAEHPRARAGVPWAAVTEADVIVLPPDDPDIGGILAARHDPPPAVAIALAGGQALRAADVERSRLVAGTELVVLAGCDTAALARQRLSDEPVGLPSAFLAAGARAVVGALWPVDDDAAALLMARMHEALLAGEEAPSALAGSQRWLAAATTDELREFVRSRPDLARLGWPRLNDPVTGAPYAAPEHWAAYVLFG